MPTKVLLVEDSTMIRKMVADILSATDDIVIVGEAANGEIGLEKVMQLKPQVVLLDLEMPVMNGLEFLKRVKLLRQVKIIVLSSLTQSGTGIEQEAIKLGAVEVINKPTGGARLDLKQKKGHQIVMAINKAVGKPV